MKLHTKDLLTLSELTPEEFKGLIQHATELKADLKAKRRHDHILKGMTLAMIFQKPSTRTRVSFETGMFQLGGHAINLAASEMQLSRGETIPDTARTLARYADGIMARVYEHSMVEEMAKHSAVPVINGLSDIFHPCQILADFMTIKEKKNRLDGLKMAWIGDGNNVCNSMIYGAALAGSSITVATPNGYAPAESIVKEAQKSTKVTLTTDPQIAARDADIIVTDTHHSIHNNTQTDRAKAFLPKYQINPNLMAAADPEAIFMHCLPAKRGQEVTSDVIDGPQSAVWEEAENRLHTQKALLAALLQDHT